MSFVPGQFQSYRAIKTIHLGSVQKNITEGTIIQFDGHKVRFGDTETALPEISAAIRVGWFVPASDTTSTYRARPAGVEMRTADSRNGVREVVSSSIVVSADERDVGAVSNIRPVGAPPTHSASRAGDLAVKKANEVVQDQRQRSSDEGTVVARIKTPASFKGVRVDGTGDTRAKQDLDRATPDSAWEHVHGDPMQGQIAGYTLSEVMPDAVTSSTPEPGIVKADHHTPKATFSSGSTSIGGQDDGVVVASIRREAQVQQVQQVQQEPLAEEIDSTPPAAITAAKIAMIRHFIPDFDWDMSVHWRIRVKKAAEFASNPPLLNAILSLETEAVKNWVTRKLAE